MYQLKDNTGKLILQNQIAEHASDITIQVSEIPSGLYYLTLFGEKVYSEKVVVVR